MGKSRNTPSSDPASSAGQALAGHARRARTPENVDGRDKPGHDENNEPLVRFGSEAASTLSRKRERESALEERLSHPSAASSSSSSSGPARIFSAISPEFARTAASILAAMSGLFFRKVLAFSRPCPMRWLS